MGGADQAASEESTGDQLLRKTGEKGREVASSGGNMLCRGARPQGCSPARTPAGGPAGACCQRPWRPADTPVQGEKPRQAAHTTGHGARPQGRQAHSKGRTSAGKDAAGNPHGHPGKPHVRRNRRHGGQSRLQELRRKQQGRQNGRWPILPKPVLRQPKALQLRWQRAAEFRCASFCSSV